MFQENSSNQDQPHSHNSGSGETNLSRLQDQLKNKIIKKQKSKETQYGVKLYDHIPKSMLTKEQKREIQKEKNRIAAQLSRDRQKKYVQDLQQKIALLEKRLQTQLCSRCSGAIYDGSTEEQEKPDEHENFIHFVEESEHNHISFFHQEIPQQQQELPLVRENSRIDVQYGNIGKYLFMVLFIVGIGLLSNSVQASMQNGMLSSGKQVSRILTQNQVCEKPIKKQDMMKNTTYPSTIEQLNSQMYPFMDTIKSIPSEPQEKCKHNFWNNYLQNVRKEVDAPYDWNLVNCNNPNLVHITSVYENNVDPINGKWTFLITNPTVTHSHIQDSGQYFVDEVSYLSGVYQMIAEKVVLKKVMGKNCLA